MATKIIRLDQLLEMDRIKIKGPTKREIMRIQHQHERDMRELERQIPIASGKARNFVVY